MELDANVTELVPTEDGETTRVFLERRRFEQATGCTSIDASCRSHYRALLDLVVAYAAIEEMPDLQTAAAAWYRRVYLPTARRLEAAQLENLFEGERIADMFVCLAEIRREQEEFLGRPICWQEALDVMLARYRACRGSGHFPRLTGSTRVEGSPASRVPARAGL